MAGQGDIDPGQQEVEGDINPEQQEDEDDSLGGRLQRIARPAPQHLSHRESN